MASEKTYLQGFNAGYRLAQYEPELFEKLRGSLNQEEDYERGIADGANEYERKHKTREGELEELEKSNESEQEIEPEL